MLLLTLPLCVYGCVLWSFRTALFSYTCILVPLVVGDRPSFLSLDWGDEDMLFEPRLVPLGDVITCEPCVHVSLVREKGPEGTILDLSCLRGDIDAEGVGGTNLPAWEWLVLPRDTVESALTLACTPKSMYVFM
jgi:hypothetical protein